MTRTEKALSIAKENLGRSVVRLNPGAEEEAAHKAENYLHFGIKNTDDLPPALIDRLRFHPEFLWLTVDKMADLGRSVDTDLVNPLTYRLMTGSTSGGCVNILKGINDLCLGTDGGGSVLAPALSCNLYSFLGKGCGLSAGAESLSTDGIAFSAGVGVIAARFDVLRKAAERLCGMDFSPSAEGVHAGRVRVAVPAPKSIPLPDGGDSWERLRPLLAVLKGKGDFEWREHRFEAPYERASAVEEVNRLFAGGEVDLILTCEGPVDVYGYDETIPRAFGGGAPGRVTGAPGKALVKTANICGCSAFTLPGGELAAGAVILCGAGEEKARMGFVLAAALAEILRRPPLFERYFTRREKFVTPSAYK